MKTEHEWLNLIEISGPFLAVPVLKEVFPQGLDKLETGVAGSLRIAHEEWREAVDSNDCDLSSIHNAWVDEVLRTALDMDESVLRRSDNMPEHLTVRTEQGITISPELALVNSTKGEEPLLLIKVYEPTKNIDNSLNSGDIAKSPIDQMLELLKLTECAVGIVTNGDKWIVVHTNPEIISSFATWHSRLWAQEPETLQAFISLLKTSRFFGLKEDSLPNLYIRSVKRQDDVTEALGEQVKRAVEMLIHALDQADQDQNRKLLEEIDPRTLYEAALTVLMRLVFLLAAEERGMLLLGDAIYEQNYAVSTLRRQLREEAEVSEEILETRYSAWTRLNALFRIVFGGIDHSTLRQPALGGSLFDPDRFPFLEGRSKNSNWQSELAKPLPIDDLTILYILDEIQSYQGRTLSYRALDVEQIGHVYEGLLERTVERTKDVKLELDCKTGIKDTRITLKELEETSFEGIEKIIDFFAKKCGRSAISIKKALNSEIDSKLSSRILAICRNREVLWNKIKPYANLLKVDLRGSPLVYLENSFIVISGDERRETGTHYTPKSLTAKIVEETLTPLTYYGAEEGKPRKEWKLKSADEILNLKICDPAMGSGAFLVQSCRWLSHRLVEAWSNIEQEGGKVDCDGKTHNVLSLNNVDPLPKNLDDRLILARRIIAEKCLYGVDRNPLAVELTKLSLWLTTIAKGYPFGFLDHNLHSGDSLLGISNIDQLTMLDLKYNNNSQLQLFANQINSALESALELRKTLRNIPIHNIESVEQMAKLYFESKNEMSFPIRVSNALVGYTLGDFRKNSEEKYNLAEKLSYLADNAIKDSEGNSEARLKIVNDARCNLTIGVPFNIELKPFHWPLEFPEVFQDNEGGFDAIVGNPPFLGGQKISGAFSSFYRDWLVGVIAAGRRGSADLVTYFFIRSLELLKENGCFGLLAVNTISEGKTREVGLEALLKSGASIFAAYPDEPWIGSASVTTSRIHIKKGTWLGDRKLKHKTTSYISDSLSNQHEISPKKLVENKNFGFQGTTLFGTGFYLEPEKANEILKEDTIYNDVIFPLLTGDDLNSHPRQLPSQYVINFWDWPESRAKEYKLAYEHILENAYPEILKRSKEEPTEDYLSTWWHHPRSRSALYHAIGNGSKFIKHKKNWKPEQDFKKQVLAVTIISNTFEFNFAPNDWIFHNSVAVIASEESSIFALLNSSFHEVFAWRYSTKFGTSLKYAPTNALETFPFPRSHEKELTALGKKFYELRKNFMIENSIGLTEYSNCFHDQCLKTPEIIELRNLYIEIDKSIARLYEWDKMDLEHDYHQVGYLQESNNMRFTISEEARAKILNNLVELNHIRYSEEVKMGYQR